MIVARTRARRKAASPLDGWRDPTGNRRNPLDFWKNPLDFRSEPLGLSGKRDRPLCIKRVDPFHTKGYTPFSPKGIPFSSKGVYPFNARGYTLSTQGGIPLWVKSPWSFTRKSKGFFQKSRGFSQSLREGRTKGHAPPKISPFNCRSGITILV